MTVIPPGFGEAAVHIDILSGSGPAFIVFGYEPAAISTPSDAATNLADVMNNAIGLRSMMSTTAFIQNVTVRQNDGGAFLGTATVTVGQAGLNEQEPAPPQVAVLIRKLTGLAGRSQRGRMYVPAIAEGLIGPSGLLGAVALADYQTWANALLIDLQTQDVPMRI
ncbi:MAG: hypothetical protein GEU78_18620, partial [Actinobacteria bacterium]|nr:hypothetical protein [Actinomycetota bacterium]